MIYLFNEHGRLICEAFKALEEPPVEPVHVFNEHGRLVGYYFA